MKTDDENRDKKLQYHIDKEVAKISALSSGTIDKYEYLSEYILHFNKRQIIEQTKFAYSPLGRAFEKQIEKQVGAIELLTFSYKEDELKQIESIFPQNLVNGLIRAKLKEIDELQDKR